MGNPDQIIRAAEEVADILESRGVGSLVIGAVALAAHGYVRFTQDLDLGVSTDFGTLRNVAQALQASGFEVTLRQAIYTDDDHLTTYGASLAAERFREAILASLSESQPQ